MNQSLNEVKVWDRMRAGEAKAFEELYQLFVQPLYAYAQGITQDKDLIKDCIHDLFVELWRNHENLGPTTSVRFYLMASIKRKLVRHLEGSFKNGVHHYNYMEEKGFAELSPEMHLTQAESDTQLGKQIQFCLDGLTKRQKEAIQLKYFQNMETEQICQSMNINHQSVYNLLFGALKIMKARMQGVA